MVDFLIHLAARAISHQLAKGERAKILTSLAVGAIGLPVLVYFFVRDGDGHVVWGWVLAGLIGGIIFGALAGSFITAAARKPPQS